MLPCYRGFSLSWHELSRKVAGAGRNGGSDAETEGASNNSQQPPARDQTKTQRPTAKIQNNGKNIAKISTGNAVTECAKLHHRVKCRK